MPNLRVIPSVVPQGLADWLSKVNLVERLRETRVFYGFDRLEPSRQPLVGMPASAMAQLSEIHQAKLRIAGYPPWRFLVRVFTSK